MDNPHFLLGEVRKLTKKLRSGLRESCSAFKDLVSLLLHLTVVKEKEVIRFFETTVPGVFIIGGTKESVLPLELNDGNYLRLSLSFHFETKTRRLSILESSYQYQPNRHKDQHWEFRYDYLKFPNPLNPYPPSHLQINGKSQKASDLHKVHFPVPRPSIEGVIRLLVEGYDVPCNRSKKIWQPVLAESERLFFEVAHIPVSGPG